jgi:hypothetical protein
LLLLLLLLLLLCKALTRKEVHMAMLRTPNEPVTHSGQTNSWQPTRKQLAEANVLQQSTWLLGHCD